MNEEEIRLIKGYFNDGYCCDLDELKDIANKMIVQLQQKENIIKEVREYVEKYINRDFFDLEHSGEVTIKLEVKGLLEILKGSDKK